PPQSRGWRAQGPAERPTSANVMTMIAPAATTFRNGSTPSNWFAAMVSTSVNNSTGTSAGQNFDHRKSCIEIGDVRMIQNAAPSADTAGKTNRTATVAITNPAM